MKRISTACVLLLFSSALACAQDHFRLLYGSSYVMDSNDHKVQTQIAQFEILVPDAGTERAVRIVLALENGETVQAAAQFLRAAGNNQEVWGATYYRTTFRNQELTDFVFRAELETVDGVMVDDNAGADYSLGADSGLLLNEPLHLQAIHQVPVLYDYGSDLPVPYFGEIALRESRYPKDVTVVYSTDGWVSVKQVSASLSESPRRNSLAQSPNAFGVEIWKFQLDLKGADAAQFFILCEADGDSLVDDNYGQNYDLQIIKL